MKKILSAVLVCAGIASQAWAEETDKGLHTLQKTWAEINYLVAEEVREAAFTQLLSQAEQMVQAQPEKTEYRVWLGIIQSSTAGAKGGLGALSLAKAAKASFEQALEQDPHALQGSAYTSLGVLYHKVPGWPIGFGSDDKAQQLLQESLKLNPQGIDGNYFYAEFLYDEKQYSEAQKYLVMAQQAAPRADRPLADQGRHKEIEALMEKVNKALK
ncbi:hypothetical protein MAQ5080_00691 [Marinomonas aquimarina]|uniref:Uncharacterized protein n=1 Tax=Marinomonas aquimarina TaxID=295068 RepID=A0A1A8T458_9GAMM|nr:hypothetical protein [Marinomonas aquimarina]SBS26981.1 hypothetical protein MAQ5080_00691 [Marinomonas aquimarina]